MLRALNSPVPPGWLCAGGSGYPRATQGPQHMWPCPLAVPRGISDALRSRGEDLSASAGISKRDAQGALRILLLGGLGLSLCPVPAPRQFGARPVHPLAVGFHARELFLIPFLEAGQWDEAFYGA